MQNVELIESGVCSIDDMLAHYEAMPANDCEGNMCPCAVLADLKNMLANEQSRHVAIAVACCVLNQNMRKQYWQFSVNTNGIYSCEVITDDRIRLLIADIIGIPDLPAKS